MKAILRPGTTTLPLAILLYVLAASPLRAAGEIEEAFRDALYAEEVKGDLASALKAYQDVGAKFELQRDLAAAALFREAECLRKLGRKDQAVVVYQKVLTHYADKERLAKPSREHLVALGQTPAEAVPGSPGPTEDEAKELVRLAALAQNSPDLLGQWNPSPLEAAVGNGHAAVVAWLLDRLPKQTPQVLGRQLAQAASLGHLKICELLVNAGAPVNGYGALQSALNENRLAVAQFLLARDVDVNEPRSTNLNILLDPNRLNLDPMSWVGPGASPSVEYSFQKITPLMSAAAWSAVPPAMITELLKAGAKIESIADAEEVGGRRSGSSRAKRFHLTALGLAVAAGDPEKVRLLLEAGANVNQIAGDFDATPLFLSLARCSEADAAATMDPVVGMLVAAGADWKARLGNGTTTLHLTARRKLSGWLAKALAAGVDVNATDDSGLTPLHRAAVSSSAEIVRTLVAGGANPNVFATQAGTVGYTPLWLGINDGARNADGLKAVRALLDGGADPNLKGNSNAHPLTSAVSGSFLNSARWPEAVKLLIERGARPSEADVFGTRAHNSYKPLDDAALEAFRVAWKAAHWRDNPRLSHAVWLSRSESALKARQEPSFVAILCDESVAAPPTLRDVIGVADQLVDWAKVTIIRQKDGTEQLIPVDVLARASEAEAKDFPLEWGDVVEAPVATSPATAETTNQKLKPWLDHGARADIRVQLGGQQRLVATADDAKGPAVRIQGQFRGDPATVIRTAGLTELFFTTQGIRRTQRDGTLGAVEQSAIVRHGDILILTFPEPQPKLSDKAMRSGIWLCQGLDGPFWPVANQQDLFEEPVPLGGLVAALLGPHALPSPSLAWEKATVRFLADEEWQEKTLLEAWPTLKWQPGTVLILPPSERDSFEPPADLREALTKALALDWNLAIGQQPLITSHWEPRFFRGKMESGAWVWRDLDPAKAGAPVLPVIRDLLAAHPSAPRFKNGPKDPLSSYIVRRGASGQVLGTASSDQVRGTSGQWMTTEHDPPVITVSEIDRPPAPGTPQPPGPNRRVILPPQ